ncbi:MAG TPA: beta-propeller domain-containing protein, partial [Solirubrobacteraceae bacterium]|nr:beta-propeller domain-containing protein [Solirubrobacteraceae bacterium]
AVIPLQSHAPDGQSFQSAVGFKVGATGIAEAGRITHPAAKAGDALRPPIGRSLVIGDRLYTLSYAGLAANRVDTLASLSFTAFPAP